MLQVEQRPDCFNCIIIRICVFFFTMNILFAIAWCSKFAKESKYTEYTNLSMGKTEIETTQQIRFINIVVSHWPLQYKQL